MDDKKHMSSYCVTIRKAFSCGKNGRELADPVKHPAIDVSVTVYARDMMSALSNAWMVLNLSSEYYEVISIEKQGGYIRYDD